MIILWSNDPEFYETVLGDGELTNQIFVKMNNNDPTDIISKYNLEKSGSVWKNTIDNKHYLCLSAESKDIDKYMSEIQKEINCIHQ